MYIGATLSIIDMDYIYIYQYISIGNTTYEPWWTWMVSNNMKTQSAPSVRNCGIGPTDLFLLWIGLGSPIHISTPRCFMSIFLLVSDGSTPPNIHFNVFAIVVCSIHRDTRTVNDKKMVKKILASHSGSTFMQRSLPPESPRPVHGPWHGLSASIVTCVHKIVMDVEQTRLSRVRCVWRVRLQR